MFFRPFDLDTLQYANVVKPVQSKEETVYVIPGSDAEDHLARRFPHKQAKRVGNGLRPRTITSFLQGLPWVFQPGKSKGLDATYHFSFVGEEPCQVTVVIRENQLGVSHGHHGSSDLAVIADSRTWLRFLAKEYHVFWALLTRKIRLKGSPRLLLAFGRCFPS